MTDNTFLGRKITGEISRSYMRRAAEQHEPEEFLEAIDKALSLPGVEAIRWDQYTPYFNDGDPCYFSTGEIRVQIEGLDEDDSEYGDGFYASWELDEDEHAIAYEALAIIERVIDHHQIILQQKFGDPALVTATTDGFDVEFYDHD